MALILFEWLEKFHLQRKDGRIIRKIYSEQKVYMRIVIELNKHTKTERAVYHR